ncbi:hypothetical protein [Demequina salsinemoris]|uniref:hypothetical protein n=1 Tax=Demequina salsinemoris TaxID=577470 RepID=UPI00191C211F|nr:hypothetical protein [Demequina salsinemoris]
MTLLLESLRAWPARRWWFALGTAVATFLFIAIPTDLIPNPLFGREIPPTPWSWWALGISSVLAGLVAATYVAAPEEARTEKEGRLGMAGGIVTFFAVGCPVCNKIVLLALGYTGAIQWFEPIQPYLAIGAIGLLGWAFVARVRRERSCVIPRTAQPVA